MSSISNIIRKEQLREIYSWTLKFLKDTVGCSNGPVASNSMLLEKNEFNKYSKDGHTILSKIKFLDVIENAVKNDIASLTLEISNTVGDGTTSAVILSSILFDKMVQLEEEENMNPYDLIREFQANAAKLKEIILERKQEFTPETAYEIAYISTNGNTEVAETIKGFYEKYGNEVYVDIIASPSKATYVREFDGLTIDSGYADTCYQNVEGKAIAEIYEPEVYCFEHPIDTPAMGDIFKAILWENIYAPMQRLHENPRCGATFTPTVILCPKIGADYDQLMSDLAATMLSFENVKAKPPILIITNIFGKSEVSIYEEIQRLSGATFIKKYIDPQQKAEDEAAGKACNIENFKNFAGRCDLVRSFLDHSVFINPQRMFKEDGTYSDMYNGLIMNLKNEIEKAQAENSDLNVVGNLKRKLHSLQCNMIQYAIGGVTVADRDAVRHLVDDAIKSCRSAALYGVGQAANIEGLLASRKLREESKMGAIIHDAYAEVVFNLYTTCMSGQEADKKIEESIERGEAFNLRTKEFDGQVIGSIMADITIFETLSKILSLLITCNQAVLPDCSMNTYIYRKED